MKTALCKTQAQDFLNQSARGFQLNEVSCWLAGVVSLARTAALRISANSVKRDLCQQVFTRATRGQITSFCETRGALRPPANTYRSHYIIFVIIVSVDPEDKGEITLQTRWLRARPAEWGLNRMRIVPWLWERLEICASWRKRQQISVEETWHDVRLLRRPTNLLFRKPLCGDNKEGFVHGVTQQSILRDYGRRAE